MMTQELENKVSSNGELDLPPCMLKFRFIDENGKRVSALIDCVKASYRLAGFYKNVTEEDQSAMEDAITRFQDWIRSMGHEIQFADAWLLAFAVQEAFQEYKKKAPSWLTLLTTST